MNKLLSLGASLLGILLLQGFPVQAQAYAPSMGGPVENVFERASYHNTGKFYQITGVSGQANNIFGWRFLPGQALYKGSYIDNLVTMDAKLIEAIYWDYLRQQTDAPLVRTRDLPNPFNSSLLEESSAISP